MRAKTTVFISLVYFIHNTIANLLQVGRQCVPTSAVQGPCHDCVCSVEGVYHCKRRLCYAVDLNLKRPKEDCQPNYLYREDTAFCTCSKDGMWKSDECLERFRFLHPTTDRLKYELRSSVTCRPGSLYLVDCNICKCDSSGFIEISACTNRYCGKGHKADACQIGDILRTTDQICACSDIYFYIDRLCITIQESPVQEVAQQDLNKIIELGRSWRRFGDLMFSTCDTEVIYSVDCNKCVCTDGRLVCTTKICTLKNKVALRQAKSATKKEDEFVSLPELRNLQEKCTPGTTYRHQCNTCYCKNNGRPSCATMMCLENYVLDENSLRGALSIAEPNADPGELLEIRDGEPCEEGKMYKKDCNTCTCQGSSLICSKMACLNFTMPNSRRKHRKKAKRSGDDINKLLLVSDREFLTLPSLSHHAAECKPSEIYKVDCNVCYCNTKKNLICDKKMCVDIKYTREIEARKLSGKPCKKMDSNKCIKCKCKKSKTFCQSIEDCETEDDQLILANKNGNSPRLAFNHTVEECKPSFVYKEKCNRCYCQPDRSLRCTSKLCLNYEQAMRLEEQRKYLEKHGL